VAGIVLPAFKSVHGKSGVIESYSHEIAVGLDDGRRQSFSRPQFMTFLPVIHQSEFLERQCQPAALSGTTQTEVCRREKGARLFLDRAKAFYPNHDVRYVDVVWKKLRFETQTRTSTVAPVDTIRLAP
jgi:hypothetical protein